MLYRHRNTSKLTKTVAFFVLVYHSTVADIRKSHSNAIVGLLIEVFKNVIMIMMFALFITVLGMRQMAINGNFLLYIMSGVFIFMMHINVMTKITAAANPNDSMLQHPNVSTLSNILAAAISALYLQSITVAMLLFASHIWFEPVVFYKLKAVAFCFMLAWLYGIAMGMLFASLTNFFPKPMLIISVSYTRLNMIFSGKMMPANGLKATILPWFIWNPLFHIIDQSRGYTFINYIPQKTSITYPIIMIFIVFSIAFMIDHWSRRITSVSRASRG